MNRILVVEDDLVLSKGLNQALKKEGYLVTISSDGEQGLYLAKTHPYDLIILDIMMPHLNGFEFVTELRRLGDSIPILLLSARNESKDKVRGLDLGADDYLTKPFDLDELLARVRRQLGKRTQTIQVINLHSYHWGLRELRHDRTKETVELNLKERKLLEFFLKRIGQIVTREQILDAVWGENYNGTDRTVDNLIVNLRKKLGNSHILTERGLGYRFVTKS